jgi:hypothetical protein
MQMFGSSNIQKLERPYSEVCGYVNAGMSIAVMSEPAGAAE